MNTSHEQVHVFTFSRYSNLIMEQFRTEGRCSEEILIVVVTVCSQEEPTCSPFCFQMLYVISLRWPWAK